MNDIANYVEVPFHFRHCCWFCGEPANKHFSFPHSGVVVLDCVHPPLTLPSCKECHQLAMAVDVDSIWSVKGKVKQALVKRYRKDLSIGINWTEQELKESQFEGGNFSGFQKSAWFMYEVAKARVNFNGWKLVVGGITVEEVNDKECFIFDGVEYPSVDDAIVQYSKNFDLNLAYLRQVVQVLSPTRFAKAVSFCRMTIGATPQERAVALKQIIANN